MSKPMNEAAIERAYNAALRSTRLEIEAARILLSTVSRRWVSQYPGVRGHQWLAALLQRLDSEMEAEMKIPGTRTNL